MCEPVQAVDASTLLSPGASISTSKPVGVHGVAYPGTSDHDKVMKAVLSAAQLALAGTLAETQAGVAATPPTFSEKLTLKSG